MLLQAHQFQAALATPATSRNSLVMEVYLLVRLAIPMEFVRLANSLAILASI